MLSNLFSWFKGVVIGGALGALLAGAVFTLSATPVSYLVHNSGALASYFGGHATQDGHGNTLNPEGHLGSETPNPSPKPTLAPSTTTPGSVLTSEPTPLPSSKPSETPHPTSYPHPSSTPKPTPVPTSSSQPATGCSEAEPCSNMLVDEQFMDDTIGAAPDDWNSTGNWVVQALGKVNKVHSDGAGVLARSIGIDNYAVMAGINVVDQSSAGGVAARMQDANNFYECGIAAGQLRLSRVQDGIVTQLNAAAFNPLVGWNFISIRVQGSYVKCEAGSGSNQVLVYSSDSAFAGGQAALIASSPVEFAEVAVETI